VRSRQWMPVVAGVGLLVPLVAFHSSLVGSLSTLQHLHWWWLPALLAAELTSMAAPAVNHQRLLRLGGLRVPFRSVLAVTVASNALSVSLPLAGPEVATGYTLRQFVRRGAAGSAAAWALLVSGLASTVAFAVLVAGGAAATGNATAVVVATAAALLAGVPAFALLSAVRRPGSRQSVQTWTERLLRWSRRAARRPAADTSAQVREFLGRFVDQRLALPDVAAVATGAITNWLADCLCLTLAVVAIGAPVPWTGLLVVYVGATAASSLRLTPGGLGVVEAALTAGLVATGLDTGHALAAALLYRLVSFWLVLVGGWVTLLTSSRARGRSDPAPLPARLPVLATVGPLQSLRPPVVDPAPRGSRAGSRPDCLVGG